MKTSVRHLFAAALLFTAGAARAHDPTESTAVARLQHGRLEMTVIMSPQMGTVLADGRGDPEAVPVNAENFATYEPRLRALAGALFEVQAGETRLAPQRTKVVLNKMGEPEFVLTYPAPESWPLRLRGRFLNRLPSVYGGSLEVFDENETLLGRRALRRMGADAELVIAEPSAHAAAGPATPAEPVPAFWPAIPAPVAAAPSSALPSFPWKLALAFLAALSGLALLWQRSKAPAKSLPQTAPRPR